MSPETYRKELLRAAEAGDWQEVDRLSRAYAWQLLGQRLRRGLCRVHDMLRAVLPRPGLTR